MISQNRIFLALGFTALTALTACNANPLKDPLNSMEGMKAETEARLVRQATDDVAAGKTEEALRLYTALHKEHPRDRGIAIVYAQLLRKSGEPEKAVALLTPFASYQTRNNDGASTVVIYNSDAALLNELAAADIATGNFDAAGQVLQRVLDDKEAVALHPDAESLMGIVLDARGQHHEAEKMFNHALEGWKGDPTPVMNNLALCLAAQGKFDAALDTLRRALVVSPNDKEEIARNISLISDLRGNIVAKPAAPAKVIKPVVKKGVHKKATSCGPCPVPGSKPVHAPAAPAKKAAAAAKTVPAAKPAAATAKKPDPAATTTPAKQ